MKKGILWTIQILLAALFLFAGGMKLAAPAAELAKQVPLSVGFIRFIGAAEILGALALVVPGWMKKWRGLTFYGALGLAIIMVGATALTVADGGIVAGLFPGVAAILCLLVMDGHRRVR